MQNAMDIYYGAQGLVYKDFTFEIEAGPDILDYIFAPLVPFDYNFHH